MRWWKALGLAGFVGVAASGVVLARAERRRRAYTPDEIRDRLHTRLAEAAGSPDTTPPKTAGSPDTTPPKAAGSPDTAPPEAAGSPDTAPTADGDPV